MNNEIKEILDNPKILMLSYGNYISLNDYVKLKDYITNLQEENERLLVELNKNMIERNNYLSRNKKAIIYIQTEYESLTDDTHLLNILNGEDE